MRAIHTPITCAHCETPIVPVRSDTKYCGVRCRVAAHRKRKREAGENSGNDEPREAQASHRSSCPTRYTPTAAQISREVYQMTLRGYGKKTSSALSSGPFPPKEYGA